MDLYCTWFSITDENSNVGLKVLHLQSGYITNCVGHDSILTVINLNSTLTRMNINRVRL